MNTGERERGEECMDTNRRVQKTVQRTASYTVAGFVESPHLFGDV